MIILSVDICYAFRYDMNFPTKIFFGSMLFLMIMLLSCSDNSEENSSDVPGSSTSDPMPGDERLFYDEIAAIMGVTHERVEEVYDKFSDLDKRRFLINLCFQTIIPDKNSILVDEYPGIFFELKKKFPEILDDRVITMEALVKVSANSR